MLKKHQRSRLMHQNQESNKDTAVDNLTPTCYKNKRKPLNTHTHAHMHAHTHTRAHARLHLPFQLSGCNHIGTWRALWHVYDITVTPAGSFTPLTDPGSSFSPPGSWIIQCHEVVLVDVSRSSAMVSSAIPLWGHSSSESQRSGFFTICQLSVFCHVNNLSTLRSMFVAFNQHPLCAITALWWKNNTAAQHAGLSEVAKCIFSCHCSKIDDHEYQKWKILLLRPGTHNGALEISFKHFISENLWNTDG